MWNESVPFSPADKLLEMVEKNEPLLIRHRGEGIVGILPFKVDDKLRKLVVRAVACHRVLQRLPPNNGAEAAVSLAVQGS